MKLRPFELALVIIFVILSAVALLLLSTFQSSQSTEAPLIGPVSIWGTLDRSSMNNLLEELSYSNEEYEQVRYRQLDRRTFSETLTNALADGVGPDILLLSHEQLIELRRRIAPISYESFPIRDVRSAYIDGAEIFALTDGLYAYPIAVDPLMMYWNRDLLANQDFLAPPQTWEDLINTYVPRLTERDFDRTITQSTVAMGEFSNITNAFGIVSMLLIQSGSEGVAEQGTFYEITLNNAVQGGQPLTTTLDFYTRFARPNNALYSWNRTFNNDRLAFLAGDLVLYFGYGSEGVDIERANPNLNFDIAEVPQGATATVRRTYGEFYGAALVRNSNNLSGASIVLSTLAGHAIAERIARENNMAPVYRSSLATQSSGTYEREYYRSAAVAYGWLNPERMRTDTIFTTAIREIVEGRSDESSATLDLLNRLELEYN